MPTIAQIDAEAEACRFLATCGGSEITALEEGCLALVVVAAGEPENADFLEKLARLVIDGTEGGRIINAIGLPIAVACLLDAGDLLIHWRHPHGVAQALEGALDAPETAATYVVAGGETTVGEMPVDAAALESLRRRYGG